MSSELTTVVSRERARVPAVDVGVLLASAAGLAHAISVPTHLRWWFASGLFFVAMAAAQLGLAALLVLNRTSARVLLSGIAGNVVVVCVYVVSRLTALPGQPVTSGGHHAVRSAGRAFLPAAPEGVGPFDLFALVVELALVALLASMLGTRLRTRVTNALMWLGIGMCVFAVWALMVRHATR
jgi:hypothetical protein